MITAPRILVCVILIFAGLYVYGLFSIKAVEARFPPLGTFVTVDGIRLHVLDRGQGPTVVLIHGANGNLRDFAASPLIDALVPTHRVLAFDRPGHGWSERPAGDWVDPDRQAALIHGAVQSMGGGKAVVVGHSLGGAIAMSYGLKFPDDTVGVLDYLCRFEVLVGAKILLCRLCPCQPINVSITAEVFSRRTLMMQNKDTILILSISSWYMAINA